MADPKDTDPNYTETESTLNRNDNDLAPSTEAAAASENEEVAETSADDDHTTFLNTTNEAQDENDAKMAIAEAIAKAMKDIKATVDEEEEKALEKGTMAASSTDQEVAISSETESEWNYDGIHSGGAANADATTLRPSLEKQRQREEDEKQQVENMMNNDASIDSLDDTRDTASFRNHHEQAEEEERVREVIDVDIDGDKDGDYSAQAARTTTATTPNAHSFFDRHQNKQNKKVSYYAVRPGFYFEQPVIFFGLKDMRFSIDAIQQKLGINKSSRAANSKVLEDDFEQFDSLHDALIYANNLGTYKRGYRKPPPPPPKELAAAPEGLQGRVETYNLKTNNLKTDTRRSRNPPPPKELAAPPEGLQGRVAENLKRLTAAMPPPSNKDKTQPKRRKLDAAKTATNPNMDYSGLKNSWDRVPAAWQPGYYQPHYGYYNYTTASQSAYNPSNYTYGASTSTWAMAATTNGGGNGGGDGDRDKNSAETRKRKRSQEYDDYAGWTKFRQKQEQEFDIVFDKRLEELKAYFAAHANVNLPSRVGRYTNLKLWMTEQQQHYKDVQNGRPSPLKYEHIMALRELGVFEATAQPEQAGPLVPHKKKVTEMTREEQAIHQQNRFNERFDNFLKELHRYKEEHGHVHVPQSSSLYKFLSSLRKHYTEFKFRNPHCPLQRDHVAAVSVLGIDLSKEQAGAKPAKLNNYARFQKRCNEKIKELKAYKAKHGDLKFDMKSTALGKFVTTMRKHYKDKQNGKPSPLLQEQITAVTDLGIALTEEVPAVSVLGIELSKEQVGAKPAKLDKFTRFQELYNEKIEELKAYKAKHGNVNFVMKSTDLGKFVTTMRKHYKAKQNGKYSPLLQEQITEVTDLGIALTEEGMMLNRQKKNNDYFQERLKDLKAFKAEHGHVKVPHLSQLYYFICRQRKLNGELQDGSLPKDSYFTADHAKILKDMGVVMDRIRSQASHLPGKTPPQKPEKLVNGMTKLERREKREDDFFNMKIEQVKAYKAEHGNYDFPVNHNLRNWLFKQRRHYIEMQNGRPSPLKPHHITKLTSLGISITSRETRQTSKDTVGCYIAFVRQHGRHPDASSEQNEEEALLGFEAERWRHRRKLQAEGVKYRHEFGPCIVTQEEIEALKEVNFCWDVKKERRKYANRKHVIPWTMQLENFIVYKEKHGHTEVPEGHPTLGGFVLEQRQAYKDMVEGKPTSLTMERYRLLSELGFHFKQTKPEHPRKGHVDGDASSGYDTRDSKDEFDSRGRPRKKEPSPSSSAAAATTENMEDETKAPADADENNDD